jgi:hypothetical protein
MQIKVYIITLLLIILSSCGSSTTSSTTTDDSNDVTSEEVFADLEQSHFGFNHMTDALLVKISELGGVYHRPHPGPFIWGSVEATSDADYDWSEVDEVVSDYQDQGMLFLATVFPYADWDQSSCHDALDSDLTSNQGFLALGDYRQQPCDMDAYKDFLTAMVDRYDGDGTNDMEDLVYPIRFWEITNEPAIVLSEGADLAFYSGTAIEYSTLLSESADTIVAADENANVLPAGMFGIFDTATDYWTDVYALDATSYVDFANYHSIASDSEDAQMEDNQSFLDSISVEELSWITELEFDESAYGSLTIAEAAEVMVQTYVRAFATGAQKIFMAGPNYDLSTDYDGDKSNNEENDFAILDGDGAETAVYTALKEMIAQIDYFTAVQRITDELYLFTVGEESIYVSWSTGALPATLTGEVIYTDLAGTETTSTWSSVPLGETVFISPQ